MNDNTINETMKPEVFIARQFLQLLDKENKQFTFEIIEEPKPAGRAPIVKGFVGSFEEHQNTLVQANLQGYGVFVTVNTTDGKGRKKENITKVRALFVDLDESPLEVVQKSPIEPHIIIESSPNRFHAYWMIENVPLDKFKSAQKYLASHFNGDSSVCDLPRLMRLPGFLHRKKELFCSRILKTATDQKPYLYEKFHQTFGMNLEEKNQIYLNSSSSQSTLNETLVFSKLKERGLLKKLESEEEGRWSIICPWANEHSGDKTACYFSKANGNYSGEGFNCFHAHCQHRNIQSLRIFLGLSVNLVDPLPLFRELPPTKMFPVEALGSILKKAAQEIHSIVKAPLSIICQSLLAAASLITQPYGNIEIDGRTIALSLFFISVAESGERKSAVDDIALSAVLKWQSHLSEIYRVEFRKYEQELERLNSLNKKFQTKNSSDHSIPEPPIMPMILIEEPTYEGLVKYLEYGQPSIGIFSDEGARFLGGNAMSKENRLKTIAGLSSLWDAKKNKPISRIRSGDKSLALYGRRVSLHLMTQESAFSLISDDVVCESQGFLPRCLISFPDSNIGSRYYEKSNPMEMPGIKTYLNQCNLILDTPFPIAPKPAPQNQLEPPSKKLTSEAYVEWIKFYNCLESKLGKENIYYSIRRFGSKAAEQVLRIAGVLAIFENPNTTQIEKNHIEQGILIIDYYIHERIRLENYSLIDPILLSAKRVLDWVSVKNTKEFSLAELYQKGPTEIRSKDKALAILRVLEKHGRVYFVLADNGTKVWRFI